MSVDGPVKEEGKGKGKEEKVSSQETEGRKDRRRRRTISEELSLGSGRDEDDEGVSSESCMIYKWIEAGKMRELTVVFKHSINANADSLQT